MNQKSLKIGLIIILIACLFLVIFSFLRDGGGSVTDDSSATTSATENKIEQPTLPPPRPATGVSREDLNRNVLNKQNVLVPVRDFLADPETELWDLRSNIYVIDNAYTQDGLSYQTYYINDGLISIELLNENLSFTRAQAETSLQHKLGIQREDMCNLMIRVTVRETIDEEYSGRDLGLSFCPNSVAFY